MRTVYRLTALIGGWLQSSPWLPTGESWECAVNIPVPAYRDPSSVTEPEFSDVINKCDRSTVVGKAAIKDSLGETPESLHLSDDDVQHYQRIV